ncbi:hypothetical protein D3C76_1486550 [compost metagenome]
MPPVQIFEVYPTSSSEYTDWLPLSSGLLSDKMKRILEIYNIYARFKRIYLVDKQNDRQSLYWIPNTPQIDALSDQTEFNPHDHTIKRLVLAKEKVRQNHFFGIKGIIEPFSVISEDVAESLLRRGLNGFILKEIALNKRCSDV